MAAGKLLCLQFVMYWFISQTFAAVPPPGDGKYYTTNGGTSNNCGIDTCKYASCDVGKYLTGCGGSSAGTCTGVCSNFKPSGTTPFGVAWQSVYTSHGGATGICEWGCPANMVKDGSTCIPTTCQITVTDHEIIDSAPTQCTYQCKKGFYGSTSAGAKGPASCTKCEAGKYTGTANSLASCISCSTGTYASNLQSTACDLCTSNTNYAASVGQSSCTNCNPAACGAGTYLSGCGPTEAGTCVGCTIT